MTFEEEIPRCDNCGGVIKSDIVFFGEPVKHIDECFDLGRKADLFFVVGSSLVVTPAAMIPSATSGEIVVVNKGEVSEFYLPSSRVTLRVDADIDAFFRSMNEELKLLSKRQNCSAHFRPCFCYIHPKPGLLMGNRRLGAES